MRLRTPTLLIVTLIVVTVGSPAAVGQEGRLTFRAKVAELGLQTGARARNKAPDDCVEVALPGRLEQPPVLVSLIARQAADWTTPERAVASIRSANAVGEREWILENFIGDERARLRSLLDDPTVLKRNLDYYKTVQRVEITGSAELRGYVIVFTREVTGHGVTRIVPVTLAKTAAGWKQTNVLSADETFDVVWAAVRAGKIRGRTLGAC